VARPTKLALIVAVLAAGALTACPGCQQKFTRQRYETIYTSMPDWQVRDVLGQPARGADDEWTYVNNSPYYRALIRFKDGKVAAKSWSVDRPPASMPDDDR
jgi:hypothetical protein